MWHKRRTNMGEIIDMENRMNISTLQTCTRTTVSSTPGDLVRLRACPDGGTAPQFGGTSALLSGAGLSGSSQQTVAVDGGCTTGPGTGGTVTYQVSDAEIVASAGGPPLEADVDGSGIGIPAGAPGTIRFITHTFDSCPTEAQHCVEYCNLAIVCLAPVCNFVVT